MSILRNLEGRHLHKFIPLIGPLLIQRIMEIREGSDFEAELDALRQSMMIARGEEFIIMLLRIDEDYE